MDFFMIVLVMLDGCPHGVFQPHVGRELFRDSYFVFRRNLILLGDADRAVEDLPFDLRFKRRQGVELVPEFPSVTASHVGGNDPPARFASATACRRFSLILFSPSALSFWLWPGAIPFDVPAPVDSVLDLFFLALLSLLLVFALRRAFGSRFEEVGKQAAKASSLANLSDHRLVR